MKHRVFLIILLIISYNITCQETAKAKLDTLYILQTTDIHGNLFSYDYFKDEPVERGLARIHSRVQQYRDKHDVILVDAGDMIQGTPLTYYFNRIDTLSFHPMIKAMNLMQYDSFTVGNHEIEQGRATYDRCREHSDFPWLSANSKLDSGETYFKPYAIIERNNLKIGIIGLTTPAIPMWLDESLYAGITWQDMVSTAREYVEILRPEVDILIGVFHSGFDETDGAEKTKLMGLPTDNASGLVAEKVPGFDLIFGGHAHNSIPANKIISTDDSTPLRIMAGLWGKELGVAELVIAKSKDEILIQIKSAWLEDASTFPVSPAISQLESAYHQPVLDFTRREIAESNEELSTEFSRLKDTSIMQLINQAQMDYTNAEISFAACFNPDIRIGKGPIQIKDVYGLYPYENYLYTVKMTGRQIKAFLEYSSRYFLWENNQLKINPKIKGYNYDMAEGISYSIDISQETGNRIIDLRLVKTGAKLKPDKSYSVAMNSYRASGGGGHIPFAEVSADSICFKSNQEMRNILIEYLGSLQTIDGACDNNWKIIVPN